MLHLFDQKYSKNNNIVKYYSKKKNFSILICDPGPQIQS